MARLPVETVAATVTSITRVSATGAPFTVAGRMLCQLKVLMATIAMIPASTAIGIFAITSLRAVTNSSNTSPAARVETRLRPLPISTLTMV